MAVEGFVGAVFDGAATACLLFAFYRYFDQEWPERYFGGSAGIDPLVSRSPWRFAAFRFGPVLAALVFAAGLSPRGHGTRAVAIGVAAVLHVGSSSGRRLVAEVRRSPTRLYFVLLSVVTAIGVVAIACLLIAFGQGLDAYVPNLKELVANLWFALTVVVVAFSARSMTAQRPDPIDLGRRALAQIEPELLERLASYPYSDSAALVAVALAEELNRPGWFRKVERLLRRQNGTYGLMQASAPRPLSDSESVEAFLMRLTEYPVVGPGGSGLRAFLLWHNDDANFANLGTEMYREVITNLRDEIPGLPPVGELLVADIPGSVEQRTIQDRAQAGVLLAASALMGATGFAMILTRRRRKVSKIYVGASRDRRRCG